MTCQCRLILSDKCTSLVSDVNNGDAMHVLGQADGKPLYRPFNLAVPLKLL